MSRDSLSKRKHSRAEETRIKLLDAGVTLFSKSGYHGVSTRDLIALADVNLSAITYHFESKLGLYRAVIDMVDEEMKAIVVPATIAASRVLDNEKSTRKQKLSALQELVTEHARAALVTRPEALNLFVQRQLNPELSSERDDVTGAELLRVTSGLVAELRGVEVNDSEVVLHALTLYGHVAIIRLFGPTTLRLMGWESYTPANVQTVCDLVRSIIGAMFR